MDKKLAKRIKTVLAALEDGNKIERCAHHGCMRLAVGLPDFGPSVEAAVCEQHVPEHATLIASLEDEAAALRALYVALVPYGIHYDPETGKRR